MIRRNRGHKRKGTVFLAAGIVFVLAAAVLAGYNLWDQHRAGTASDQVLQAIEELIRTPESSTENMEATPAYLLNPEMEMPITEIDGRGYIGKLSIPALELELPVLAEWSYPSLKIAPCRYAGSAYMGNFVIAAHNYQTHFGKLQSLSPGDEILFQDMDGNRFQYRIAGIEVLPPDAVEEMKSDDWDLTLFTCTYGGQTRLTVRCERMEVPGE